MNMKKSPYSAVALGFGVTAMTSALVAFAAPPPPNPANPVNPARPGAPALPPPSERPAPPTPGVVAQVNGENITREELVDLLLKRYGSTALEQIIDQKILEQAAAKQNVSITPKDLELQYDVYRATQPQMIQQLEQQYGKDYLLANMIKPGVIVKKIGETLVNINPADLEEVRASHVLITPETAPDEAGKQKADEAARALAQQVADEARKPGADFAALAKKYSKDPGSAQRGGDLDYFGRGRMVGPFEDAAFQAKVGEIIGPVKTDYGYHVIKVTDRRDTSKLSPVQLEQKREQLIMSKAREPIQQWVNRQKQAAKVERYSFDTAKAASK